MIGTGAVLLCLIVYLLRLDDVIGMYVDDAWYVLLGKALATGQGYTMINSPTPGVLPPLYPPAFPFLLSLVFRLAPDFPQNLWLLKSISVVAMLGVGMAAYLYFQRVRELSRSLALALALALALSPMAVLLATTMVMSDAVFLLSLLLIVIFIEQGISKSNQEKAWRYALAGGALMAVAFLTRSISIGLALAVAVYLLKKRRWRETVVFGGTATLLIAPWLLYARTHAATPEQLQEQNGYIVQSYKTQFWQNEASVVIFGTASITDLPKRVWRNCNFILRSGLGELILSDSVYQLKSFGFARILILQLLGILVIVGYLATTRQRITLAEIYVPISMAITIIWPFREVRYLLPLLPFILLYGLTGIQTLLRWVRFLPTPGCQKVWQVAAWSLVLVSIWNHVNYVQALSGPPEGHPRWTRKFAESKAILAWLKDNIPQQEIIATDNAPLIHLFTGHRTISSDELQTTQPVPVSSRPYWNKLGIRYAVGPWVPPYFMQFGQHRVLYRPRGEQALRVVEPDPLDNMPMVRFIEFPDDQQN